MQKLERILSDIAPGWQVDIQRIQPGWAKGHLESIDVQEGDEPISMNYLTETWGGNVLRLRVKDNRRNYVGGCDVPLYSFPPKVWGKPLRSPMETQAEEKASPLNGLTQVETMLGLVERLKGKPDLTTAEMLQLFLKMNRPAPQPDPMAQILATVQAIKQMRGIFGDDKPDPAPSVASGDGDNMIAQINSLLDTFLKIKATAEPPKRLISGPSPGAVPNPAPSPITDALKTMDSKQIAETFLGSVGQLPEEKRTAIFQNIFDMLGINQDGDDYDEVDEDDDPDLETLDD